MAQNPTLTPKVARRITADLDRVADLFTNMNDVLGVHPAVASDFARKCDWLSDHIEHNAGINPTTKRALTEDPALKVDYPKVPSWDPEQIGQEKAGPHEGDMDEKPYMGDEFTQRRFRELRERQEGGDLEKHQVIDEKQTPTPGKQATMEDALNHLSETHSRVDSEKMRSDLVGLQSGYHKAASQLGKSRNQELRMIAGSLAHIASELGQAALAFDGETVNPYMKKAFGRMIVTASEALPHIRTDLPQEHIPKLAELVELTSDIVSA
jgi:hypothetical protein